MKNLTLSFLASVIIQFSFGQQKSEVYTADLGNGFYQNPILHADYSDPDVIAVGDDFFMTSSSFNAAPGLPILHSKDMVNWALINHALPYLSPRTHFLKHLNMAKGFGLPQYVITTTAFISFGEIQILEFIWLKPKIPMANGTLRF